MLDQGTEFQSRALENWAYRQGVQLGLGKSMENAFVESFSGCFRDECLDECLNVHQFALLSVAQAIIEAWRMGRNHRRPHSSLGHLTPTDFIDQRQALSTVEEVHCSG